MSSVVFLAVVSGMSLLFLFLFVSLGFVLFLLFFLLFVLFDCPCLVLLILSVGGCFLALLLFSGVLSFLCVSLRRVPWSQCTVSLGVSLGQLCVLGSEDVSSGGGVMSVW